MDFLEEFVMLNLCARYPGELFFCPQFEIGQGWSCPDFLVLYPKEKQIWLVEVTGAASATTLASEVRDREKQWLVPLREQLSTRVPMAVGWDIGVKLFIRKDAEPMFKRAGPLPKDVELFVLEELGFAWEAWRHKLKPQTRW
jgi:hypothetical protein